MAENVTDFKPWEVVEFPWGRAVRHAKGRWDTVIIAQYGFEYEWDVSEIDVILHENGIEFIGGERD